jgi:hypothetical protein
MKNKEIIAFISIAVLLAASQAFTVIQTARCRASVESLSARIDEFITQTGTQLEGVREEMRELEELQKTGTAGIWESLEVLSSKSDAQMSQTAGMKKTYDDLYEEQRKKTLDTTSQDTAVAQIKRDAEKYYSEKNYAAAYREFVKVLSYQKDDMESRLKKMKSLYYKNRADSSKYTEILEDIRILKANGLMDSEATEIERIITAEREGLDG